MKYINPYDMKSMSKNEIKEIVVSQYNEYNELLTEFNNKVKELNDIQNKYNILETFLKEKSSSIIDLLIYGISNNESLKDKLSDVLGISDKIDRSTAEIIAESACDDLVYSGRVEQCFSSLDE